MLESVKYFFEDLFDEVSGWIRRNVLRSMEPAKPARVWHLSVLLDVDDAARTMKPIVDIEGPILTTEAWLLLQAADRVKGIRFLSYIPHIHCTPRTEASFGEIPVPKGTRANEVARWNWTVVLGSKQGELSRCEARLVAAGSTNAEAEITASA